MTQEQRLRIIQDKFARLDSNYRLVLDMWGQSIKENKRLKKQLKDCKCIKEKQHKPV